jgi:hypothetical protein
MRRLLVPSLLAAPLVLGSSSALAEGTAIRADLAPPNTIKLDGVIKEWNQLVHLDRNLKGSPSKTDLDARAAIAYDANHVYVGVEVTDDDLRAGGDHVQLVIGFPGGITHEVLLYPGDPGKTPGAAKAKGGGTIAGARVVEAPQQGGWSLEASIPWSAFPEARTVRIGMRGAIFVHDADGGTSVKNIVGTASSTAYGSLPPLSMEPEQALGDGLLRDKGLTGAPKCNLVADVVGTDGMKERVLVFEHYLAVLGPTYRGGSEYYFTDVEGSVLSCETRDVTGDGLADIVLKKRYGTGSRTRDVLQIISYANGGEVPQPVFQHEIGVASEAGSVTNDVVISPEGRGASIRITPGRANGASASNWREPTETSWDPVLLPWGTVASQSYKFSGGKFEKASEDKQAGVAAPPARHASGGGSSGGGDAGLPKAPPPPSAAELQAQVYDAYKKDRGVSGSPRFDLAVDVSGDGKAERVLVHDRDIVIFGKGFKGGTGYTYLTLSQFAAGSDILEVTARDVTGDGKAEILVRGVQHAPAPASAGGSSMDREVVLVFTVAGEQLRRIFAAETARAVGHKRVSGSIAFRSGEIQLGPGRATEWTEKTYPFGPESSAVGGYEPLILPWGGGQPARYRWTGQGFSR